MDFRIAYRYTVAVLHDLGYFENEIINITRFRRSFVSHWINVYASTGDVRDARRIGRPRVVDEEVREQIIEYAAANVHASLRDIAHHFTTEARIPVSHMHVKRILNADQLFQRLERVIPTITQASQHERLRFATDYAHDPHYPWKKAVFLDEIHFGVNDRRSRNSR